MQVRLVAESLKFLHYSHLNLRFKAESCDGTRGDLQYINTGFLLTDKIQTLRKHIREQRNNLDLHEQRKNAWQLQKRLKQDPYFKKSQHIAIYLPVQGEIGTMPVIQEALDQGKHVYLPILMPFLHNRLWFAPFTLQTPMRINKFGIPEPVYSGRYLINAQHLDLVITPLLAFDKKCNRMGMGGGYYDRTFSFLRYRKHWKKPRMIGVGYEFQKQKQIMTESWDVSMDKIITELDVYQ